MSHEDLAYKIAQHEVRQLQMLVKKQKFICIKFQIHLYSSVAFYQKSCVSAGTRRVVNRNKFASPNLSIHTHTHIIIGVTGRPRDPLGSLVGILFP